MKNRDAVLASIKKEIVLRKDELNNQEIESIYFGGGTPSVLSVDQINELIGLIHTNYVVIDNPEITLEANPDDLALEKIEALSATKINRLSIGIQSFYEEDLQFMNRSHTALDAEMCLQNATRYFSNITLDLIYGIPKMDTERWQTNIKKAINFGIQHISAYALTVEEKTALHHFVKEGKIPPLDEALALQHFEILVDLLEENGFEHYEISNFSKPGFYSKHNTSYWMGQNYLGIGPAAHSYNGQSRSWNIANNSKYLKAIEKNVLPLESELLSKSDRFNEYIMTGLRTIWGVSYEKIEKEFGIEQLEVLRNSAKTSINQGLLAEEIRSDSSVYLMTTKKGKFLADGLASNLFIV